MGEAADDPQPWLYAGILLFATLGTIGANPSVFKLGMLLVFGLLGFAMRLFGYPIAPVVVGLILGPMAEQQLRRALAISQGDVTALFILSPIAAVLFGLAFLAVIVPLILRARGKGEVAFAVCRQRRLTFFYDDRKYCRPETSFPAYRRCMAGLRFRRLYFRPRSIIFHA